MAAVEQRALDSAAGDPGGPRSRSPLGSGGSMSPGPTATTQPHLLLTTLMHRYARGAEAMAWSGGIVELMGELGFSEAATRMALSRLVRRGVLVPAKQGRRVFYMLDGDARETLDRAANRAASVAAGGARPVSWTVLWHHGPAESSRERGRLGRRLRPLGFGTLRTGVWIAAHDRAREAAELLDELDLAETVSAVVGPGVAGLAPQPEEIWDFDGLDARYRAFERAFAKSARALREARSDGRAALVLSVRADAAFRELAAADPGLPVETAGGRPAARAGATSCAAIIEEQLRAAAQWHFNELSSSWMSAKQRRSPSADSPSKRS